ncbi:MAG TPA: glycoside hydrolase family 28 protein [Asticcacaulis sp.]|nr:glycoside hydrolase family 28 protein [Asticcacaulis sp.]
MPNRRTLLAAGLGMAALPSALPAFSATKAPASTAAPKPPVKLPTVKLNVKDFGATGDGATKDTAGIQMALDRCAVLGGGEVLVPAGTYLTGAIRLGANTTLRLDEQATLQGSPDLADYPLTQVRWEGKWIKGYLGLVSAMNADNIAVVGKGKILGNTDIKGRVDRATGVRHPALLEPVACSNVQFDGLFTQQNDMWSIHPVYCSNISFRNMTVNGNADGIDVDSCQKVVIDNCNFDTADDCISLKSGRGEEGFTLLRTTDDVTITNCTFKDKNWACIGIGSETSGGIRNVRVDNCKCLSARTFAIYIKSRPGRGAFIENISMSNLDVTGAQQGFLRLNFLDSGKQDEVPVAGLEGIPTVRNFSFSHIRVHDLPALVEAVNIHPDKPMEGFTLTDVTGTCAKGISLGNMKKVTLKDIKVTGFSGPLLSTHNVTGTGLEGAVDIPAAKLPDPVAAPAPPYVLG